MAYIAVEICIQNLPHQSFLNDLYEGRPSLREKKEEL